MKTDAQPANVERFLAAYVANWNERTDLGRIFHPEGLLLVPGGEPMDVARVEAFVNGVKAGIPDVEIELLDWAAREDRLYTEWVMRGTLAGRGVRWCGINRNTLRGDRSVEAVSFWDRLGLLEQVDPSRPRLDLLETLGALQNRSGMAEGDRVPGNHGGSK